MEKIFKISRFIEQEGEFVFSHFDEYKINLIKSSKAHLLKLVINGSISEQNINVLHPTQNGGYKKCILQAISEYVNEELKDDKVKKVITYQKLKALYSKSVINNLQKYFNPINKEVSRDKLTEFNLI